MRQTFYAETLKQLRAIRGLLERPPALINRDQIRIGQFLVQKWPRATVDQGTMLSVITPDGERRVIREADIETAIQACVKNAP